ncbi:MAG: universal stress protein [Sphaerospermopsis sp. SIO1G2]|nr:universal stress protein [Sphaerospermopsis sp. SIO1G2]
MKTIIACVDGSEYADHVCHMAAWAALRLKAGVTLLHTIPSHSQPTQSSVDLSGAIGLGARSSLLDKLASLDESQSHIARERGQLILDHAQEVLQQHGVKEVYMLHRRGGLAQTLSAHEGDAALVIMGKRGEHAHMPLGSNLERVARALHTPLLVVPAPIATPPEIRSVLCCVDESASSQRAVDYLLESPVFLQASIRLLHVGHDASYAQALLQPFATSLQAAGYQVACDSRDTGTIEEAAKTIMAEHRIDLLMMGAYNHARLHQLLLGSTTAAMLAQATVPVLLCRG